MFSRVRKPSERGLGFLFSNFKNSNGSILGKRYGWESSKQQHPFNGGLVYHHHRWSPPTSAGCHRGFAHPSRRWVPREPLRQNHGSTTLFVDSLPIGTSRDWVHGFFSGVGKVVDVYISRKPRKNYTLAFGFVRFKWKQDALAAIDSFHGMKIKNCEIKVSLAKYPKAASSFDKQNFKNPRFGVITYNKSGIENVKCRDNSNYNDVLNSVRRKQLKENSEKVSHVSSTVEREENIDLNEQSTVSVESSESEAGVVDCSPNEPDDDREAVVVGPHVPLENMERCTTHDVSGNRIEGTQTVSNVPLENMERSHLEVTNPGPSTLKKIPSKGKRLLNQKEIAIFLGYYSNSTDEGTKKRSAT
ncbi:unnamed protein product [Amaranthus hypochondriacus]